MNRVDGSPIEKYISLYQCRSISVGDIVFFRSKYFRCKVLGWEEILEHDVKGPVPSYFE